jgi:RHS repeat-associated protein
MYGLDRLSQTDGTATEYFLTDGLGSVRQLVDGGGNVTLAKSYQPYGTEMGSTGSGASVYGFSGEMTDPTGLTYLRARYYASGTGRFVSRDTWNGDYYRPLSLNRWNYVNGNAINYTDPSGESPQPDAEFQACIAYLGSSTIKEEACNMITDLEDNGFLTQIPDVDHITQGNRTQREAHAFSTAYHILHDFVSIEDLRKTPVDSDRNVWYKPEWDALYCSAQNIYVDPQLRMQWLGYLDYLIKKNASEYGAQIGGWSGSIYTLYGSVPDVSYALEGYERSNPKRLPNSSLPGISKHTYGQAADIGRIREINGKPRDIPKSKEQVWGLPNSDVDRIARRWGLHRPLINGNYAWYTDDEPSEWWHFEPLWVKE